MFFKKNPMVFNISTKILGNDLQLSEYAMVEPFLGCKKDRFLGIKMLKSVLLSCLCIQTLAPASSFAHNKLDFNDFPLPHQAIKEETPHLWRNRREDITFQSAMRFNVGKSPQGIVTEDLNNDGKLDIVTANHGSNDVSVSLGNGDGTFILTKTYGTGTGPSALVASDFNNDGALDIVTTDNDNPGRISFLQGNGDGTFETAITYRVGGSNLGIAAGDFNHDNKIDIVTINVFGVYALLGRGDGTFSTPSVSKYNIGGDILGVNVADFNNDNNDDIAVVSNYASFGVNSGYAYVLLSRGDGTFSSRNFWSIGAYPYAVSSGDFNNDGMLDLISANYLDVSVSILRGNGDGTFTSPAKSFGVYSGRPLAIRVTDFNRDGKLDVVTANYLSNNGYYASTVFVLLGNGDGTLTGGTSYNVGLKPYGVTVGDFNSDNRTDIASCNWDSNSVSILLLATPTTTTTSSTTTSTTTTITTTQASSTTSSPTTMSTTSTLTASTTTRSPTTSPSPPSTSTTTSPEITNLDLSNLSVIQGFSIFGAASQDWAGHAVSNAGDINNDGYADFLVAAVGASPNGRANAGKTYLIYGGDNLGAIELTNLPSTRGFSISGVAANDQSGYSLSSAGDVNKDGYPDFLIGAATASPNGRSFAGQSYVVYGGVDLTNIDLAHLSPARGFTISGAEGMAGSVGGAGDVNGDGYADLIVGAPSFTASGRLGSGRAYIIYGGPGLSDVDLSNFSSSQGMTISGALANDGVGGSVSGTDINGDGYSDLVTGASKASSHGKANAGKTYVIYGGRGLTNIDLASFTSSQGFFIGGASEGDSSGQVVREAGDVNKDGYPDIVIGAPDADPSARTNAGAIYVIYGGPNHSNIDLADLPSSKGFSIMGATANDYSGNSVSGAGDVNKDGYDDVLIGAIEASPEGKLGGGKSYVVFGGAAPSNVDLATLSLTEGFYIAGAVAGDASGSAVSNAGDVNQDGYTDLLIGAVTASSNGRIQAGQAYLIYGGGGARIVPTTTHLPSDPDVSSSTTYQSRLAPVIGGVLGGIAIMTTAFLLAKKFFRPNRVVPAPDDAGGPGMQGVEA